MIVTVIFIAIIILVWLFLISPKPAKTDGRLLCNYAHRGLHGRTVGDIPENSLAAFRKAAEEGYGIELDIQLSADGEVMVFHDYILDRMTAETGNLSERTAAELASVRLKNENGGLTDETIPTLREVLEAVAGRVPILVELKGESTDTSLCPKADAILSGYSGAYCVESFNPMLLGWYRKNRPDVIRGLLYTDVFREKGKTALNLILSGMLLNVIARPEFVAYDFRYADKLPVKLTTGLLRAEKFAWTVRSEDDLRKNGDVHVIFENVRPEK